RFLFEVGPEHADKKRWATAWRRSAPRLAPVLRRVKNLAWFKNEHDEEPAAPLADLAPDALAQLGDELTRTRDGQLVIGRAVPAAPPRPPTRPPLPPLPPRSRPARRRAARPPAPPPPPPPLLPPRRRPPPHAPPRPSPFLLPPPLQPGPPRVTPAYPTRRCAE